MPPALDMNPLGKVWHPALASLQHGDHEVDGDGPDFGGIFDYARDGALGRWKIWRCHPDVPRGP